ncbi:MAG: SURF1 family protein, partial [Alphaproteobacteria bacterium]|nr:SURF1 family protein [Alphaproteobacteria bacterium]
MSIRAPKLFVLSGCIAVIAVTFALGVWQLERREWKHALIAQVEAQQQAEPVPAPTGGDTLTAYQKVYAQGHWVVGKDTLVLAVTKLGRGYWLMTPLATTHGHILINRGFIPETLAKTPNAFTPPLGEVTVHGLLRLSEPP